jgi:glycosyltransferase involved in cell wall biosynthesis
MSASLRVLLVCHGLAPESVGGVEQHVEGLAAALRAAGHGVEIDARTARRDLPQGTLVADAGGPVPVTRVVYRHEGLSALRDLYRVPLLEAAFRAFLANRRFDVAHVHHLTGISLGVLGELAAAGVPAVVTLHDYWLICPRGQMWHRRGERCELVDPARCAECLHPTWPAWVPAAGGEAVVAERHADAVAALRTAAAVVVPSARVLPPFAALGLEPARVTVVENGVDVGALRRLPPPARAGGALRVGYLGTLIPSKGLDVLIDAVRLLAPGTATLAVHGNAVPYHGDEGFLTRAFARLAPGDGVCYHGPYRTSDLPRILADLDVVAAPALWHEAFGLTVREALAAGRPVVVSRVGGLQDAVADGTEGFVVPPGDAAALAAALQRLAADPALLARMGQSARARSRGFAEMAADLVAVYRRVGRPVPG